MTDHTARPESWGHIARVERLEQAQQPIPRYNLRFRGVDLVPPIDCPDSVLWIAERVYEMATASVICQHVVTTDEGSSYCSLAEGNSSASLTSSAPALGTPAGQGELVRSVALAIPGGSTHVDWTPEARRAIFAAADWLVSQGYGAAANTLRREVGR
jgi:hypothetical protein